MQSCGLSSDNDERGWREAALVGVARVGFPEDLKFPQETWELSKQAMQKNVLSKRKNK